MSQGQKRTPETAKRLPELAQELCTTEQSYDQLAKQFLACAKIAKELFNQCRARKSLRSAKRYAEELVVHLSAEVPGFVR